MSTRQNSQIAEIMEEIADLLELKGKNPFRIRSYRNAARTVSGHSDRFENLVADGADLQDLPNIGGKIAGKIEEIVETGTCRALEKARKNVPPGLLEMMRVPGLGPKKVKSIYDELGIEDIGELEKACREGKLRSLEGFGPKTEKNLLEGISILRSTSKRILLKEAGEHVESLCKILDDCTDVEQFRIAGSYRRCKETVGDLDFLVESTDRESTADRILSDAAVDDVINRGEEKLSLRLSGGVQVDFRFFEKESFGAALLYFTGSKAHNIALRKIARKKDWKLNEYGLFEEGKAIAGATEEEVYGKLGMDWITPELREDNGEIDAAIDGNLPRLVELDQIKGDLHCHSKASDGKNTIREMADAAIGCGYSYLVVSDHSKTVNVAGGLDDDELRKHAGEIREIDSDLDDFRLMAGVEVDILKDGSLDIDEELLAELDWVTASIHYNFNMSEKEMTKRLLSAVNSGVVHCLGHPMARQFGRRDPIAFDLDKVFEACAREGVCLEINAQPERLDLPDIYCRRARDAGVKFAVNTDAHSVDGLDFMRFGVGIARRGWLEKDDIVNTGTVARFIFKPKGKEIRK